MALRVQEPHRSTGLRHSPLLLGDARWTPALACMLLRGLHGCARAGGHRGYATAFCVFEFQVFCLFCCCGDVLGNVAHRRDGAGVPIYTSVWRYLLTSARPAPFAFSSQLIVLRTKITAYLTIERDRPPFFVLG